MKKGINMKLLRLTPTFLPPPRNRLFPSSTSLNFSRFSLSTPTKITLLKSRIHHSSLFLHLVMALARLALKNLQQRAPYSASILAKSAAAAATPSEKQRWATQFLRGLSSAAAEEKAGAAHEVAVQEGGKKSKLSPRRRGRRGGGLWRRDGGSDFVPALWDIFPSGLGNALVQATENINRLLENVAPPQLVAREHDDSYKLRYHMPGVGKDEVKITVEDGVLSIKGEHKDEKEQDSDDEFWSSTSSYGYYNTSMLLPEDAKVDEIKAEMKDGVLNVVIPKVEKANKDVKEVKVY